MLLYSCSDTSVIELKKHKMMFVGMMKYLEFISQNIPYMFRNSKKAPKINLRAEIEEQEAYTYGAIQGKAMALEEEPDKPLNVFDNYNFEIFDLMKGVTEQSNT